MGKKKKKDERKIKDVKPQACGCVVTTYEKLPDEEKDPEVITACVPHGFAEVARSLMDAGQMLLATADRIRKDQNMQTMAQAMSDMKGKKS